MSNGPDDTFTIQRDGDTWALAWGRHGVAMGIDELKETRDGLRAAVTVESTIAGRVVGPDHVNMLSTASKKTLATYCHERVNGLSKELWLALVTQACSVVVKQYRQPTPTQDLSKVAEGGPMSYVVPGLVPTDETSLLYGDGGSGKSLLALEIALCVAAGRELPWGSRPTQGNVLYLDWETNPQTMARRLRRLSTGELCGMPAIFYRQCFRPLADELPSIREEIDRKQIILAVVDSIGFAASGALTEDETARAAMNALRNMTPATRLVVAHVSKETATAGAGVGSPFGSRFFWNGMRSGIEVRRAEDQPNLDAMDLGLYHRKTNDDRAHRPIALRVDFDGSDGGILFSQAQMTDAPDLLARTPLSSRLRVLLRQGKRSTETLAEETGAKSDTVFRTLKRMPDAEQLEGGGGRSKPAVWGLRD